MDDARYESLQTRRAVLRAMLDELDAEIRAWFRCGRCDALQPRAEQTYQTNGPGGCFICATCATRPSRALTARYCPACGVYVPAGGGPCKSKACSGG